jgi:hypothetical protein
LPCKLWENGAQQSNEEHHAEKYSALQLSGLCFLFFWIADLEDTYDENKADYEIEDSDEEWWPTNAHTVAIMIRHCFFYTLILFLTRIVFQSNLIPKLTE